MIRGMYLFSSLFRARVLSAAAVAGIAFWCYRATLLPGLDLGDPR